MITVIRVLYAAFVGFFASRSYVALRMGLLEQQMAAYKRRGIKADPRNPDRFLWVAVFRLFPKWWKELLRFVQPATVVGWHRKGFRAFWGWRSKHGRPQLEKDLIQLIARLSLDNPGWGAKRIAYELEKLGHEVSPSTVRKYMLKESSRSPGPRAKGQSWKTFLRNHAQEILACDFLVQHTVAFNTYYVFIVMQVGSRKILRAKMTDSPTLDWVKNQLRDLFSFEHPYRYLIHDNDQIFGQFGAKMKQMTGVRCHLDHWLRGVMNVIGRPTPYYTPNANAFVERFNRSLREEALDHFIFLSERHLQRVVDEYVQYYNTARPSQGTGKIPDPPVRLVPVGQGPAANDEVVGLPVLGGLHHDYRRAA